MGWGTDFTADIYLSRQIYENTFEIKEKIREIDIDINRIKNVLHMLAASNIKDITPEEWKDEPIDFLNNKLEDLFLQYEELIVDRKLLYLLLDNRENNEKTNI